MGQTFSKYLCCCCRNRQEDQPTETATVPPSQPTGRLTEAVTSPSPPAETVASPSQPFAPPTDAAHAPAPEVHPNQAPETVASPSPSHPTGAAASPSQPIAPPTDEAHALEPEAKPRPFTERDFWKEAVEMLPQEYEVPEKWRKAEIDRKEVVDTVNAKMEDCRGEEWKIKINNKEVVVREVFGKILDWVQPFAAVGDAAVQYDPGNAALPWAGFRFVLQVAVNDRKTYGEMLAGLERATWLTAYCWAQECLYKEYFADNSKYSDLNNAFIKDLVDLYTAILRFLIQAHRYYTKGATARIAGAIISPGNWAGELMKAINYRKLRMEDYASLVHKSNVHQDLKNMLGMLEPFSKYMSEEAARREEEERQEFMKWLSGVDYRGDHAAISREILEHSGDWLLSREEKFQSWKESGGLLWLRGIAGAGKTKLTSTIIDHLMKADENHTVAYFYCIKGTAQPKNQDPEEILRAILKQLIILLPSRLSEAVKAKYKAEKEKGRPHGSITCLTFQECANFIVDLAAGHPVTIVIDALDECRESGPPLSQGGHTDRQDLLVQLKKMVTKTGCVKVFLSSRDDEDIRDQLQGQPNISIDALQNGDDILRFTKSEVDKLIAKRSYLRNDENLKQEIIKVVNHRADGMFRFAALQIDYLGSLNTRGSVEEGLRELPTTLNELYDEIYRRIATMKDKESSVAKRALSWLLCAQRRLLSSELLAAVSPDPDQQVKTEELLRLCRHLVILNEVSDSFEFAHLSVREYLERRDEYKDGQPHAVVAERCIKLFEPEVPRGILDPYASLYWMDHYNSRPQTEDALTDMAKKFFRVKGVNPAFEAWAKLAEASSQELPWRDNLGRRLRDSKYKPLSVICVFGFPKLLDQWMDTLPGYSYFRDSDDMVVHFAIKWGNEEVVRLLLQQDAEPTIDKFGFTSPFWAALFETLPVLEVLKEHGNVDARDEMGWTALDWMVVLGAMERLKLLLRVGAGTHGTNEARWTALHWAALLGREAEAKELAGYPRLDAEDSDGLTPFQWATFLGHEGTAKYLRTGDTVGAFRSSLRIGSKVKAVRVDWKLFSSNTRLMYSEM